MYARTSLVTGSFGDAVQEAKAAQEAAKQSLAKGHILLKAAERGEQKAREECAAACAERDASKASAAAAKEAQAAAERELHDARQHMKWQDQRILDLEGQDDAQVRRGVKWAEA